MDSLSLVIANSDGQLFNGSVVSLSSINEKGEFDVLPYHENFISIIKDKIFFVENKQKKNQLTIDQGIMMVEGNKVVVYVGIGTIG